MTSETYDIQQLVTTSGVPRRTIYFYVQQGLLPPPNGAGLAAHYTEDHLLRLRLIPVLRDQGLRLDEIRERFGRMSADEMRAALAAAPVSIRPAPAPLQPGIGYPPVVGEQVFTHYQLPAGISLVAPANLDPLTRRRLEQLLESARQIFAGRMMPIAHLDANPSDSPDEATDDGKPFSA